MSKTKKAVIIGSVLVGIGVIIGFIGIAIGGFKFPNGAVDLTTMKALHTEKKTVQIADAFDKIEIAGQAAWILRSANQRPVRIMWNIMIRMIGRAMWM